MAEGFVREGGMTEGFVREDGREVCEEGWQRGV